MPKHINIATYAATALGGLIALATVLLVALALAPSAHAEFGFAALSGEVANADGSPATQDGVDRLQLSPSPKRLRRDHGRRCA